MPWLPKQTTNSLPPFTAGRLAMFGVAIALIAVMVASLFGGNASSQPADTNELMLQPNGQLTPYAIDTEPYDTVAADEPLPENSNATEFSEPLPGDNTIGAEKTTAPPAEVNDATSLDALFANATPVISRGAMLRVALGFAVVLGLLFVFFRWGLPMVLRLPSVRQRMETASYSPKRQHPQKGAPQSEQSYIPNQQSALPPENMPPAGYLPEFGEPLPSQVAENQYPPSAYPSPSLEQAYVPPAEHYSPQPSAVPAPAPAQQPNNQENMPQLGANGTALPMTVVKRFKLNRHDAVELVSIWDRYFLVANSRLGSVLLAEFAKTDVAEMMAPPPQNQNHPWQPYTDDASPYAAGIPVAQWACQLSDMPTHHPSAQWLQQYPQIVEESLAMLNQPPAQDIPTPQPQQAQSPAPQQVNANTGWAAPANTVTANEPPAESTQSSRLGQLLRKYSPYHAAAASNGAYTSSPSASNTFSQTTPAVTQRHVIQQAIQQETAQWQPVPSATFAPDIHSQLPHQYGTEVAAGNVSHQKTTSDVVGELFTPAPPAPAQAIVAVSTSTRPVAHRHAPQGDAPAPQPQSSQSQARFSTGLAASAPRAVERLKQLRDPKPIPPPSVPQQATPVAPPVLSSESSSPSPMYDKPAPTVVSSRLPSAASLSQPLVAKTVSPVPSHPVEEAIEVYDDYDDTF